MKNIILSSALLFGALNSNDEFSDLSFDDLLNVKIYSATKSYERVEDISSNIIVITREEIEKYGYVTLKEVFEHTPGMYMLDIGSSYEFGSRGLSASSYTLLKNGSKIATNRIPASNLTQRLFFTIPIESIDRIEISKGPQPVIYGTNSILGSINIITNDLNTKKQISTGLGNNDQKKVFAKYVHKNDNGGFVLNAGYFNNDGTKIDYDKVISDDFNNIFNNPYLEYKDSVNTKNTNKYAELSYKYKDLTINVSEKNVNNLAYFYHKDLSNKDTYINDNARSIALVYETNINDKLSTKASYSFTKREYELNNAILFHLNKEDEGLFDHITEREQTTQDVDIYFNYTMNKSFKFLFGISQEKHSYDNHQVFGSTSSDSIKPYLVYDGNGDAIKYQTYLNGNSTDAYKYERIYSYDDFKIDNVYGKITYSYGQKFISTLGVRRIDIGDSNLVKYNNKGIAINTTGTISDTKTLPELTFLYHINKNNHIKTIYSEGLQSSSLSEDNKIELIKNYELNYLYFKNNFKLNVSLYKHKASDLLYDNDSGTKWPYSLEGKGIEFAINYKYTKNLDFMLSFVEQESDFLDSNVEVPFSPKNLFKFNTSYKFGKTRFSYLFDYISGMKGYLKSDNNGNGTYERRDDTIPSSPVYKHTINVNHKFDIKSSLNFHVSNVTNKTNAIPAWGWPLYGASKYPLQQREMILTYKYEF